MCKYKYYKFSIIVIALLSSLIIGCSTQTIDEDEEQALGSVHWADDTDAGDDIWKGGCHWKYSDAACSNDKTFFRGDACKDRNKTLKEWYKQECHGPTNDKKFYKCKDECIKAGHAGGSCVTLPNHCGDGNNSAKCECNDDMPTKPKEEYRHL